MMLQSSALFMKILSFIPLGIALVMILLVPLFNTPLVIFPHNTYKERISAYADEKMGGKSTIIDFKIFTEKILFTYELRKSSVASFAGIYIDVSSLDISSYNTMEIHLTPSQPVQFQVTFVSFVDGESRISELDTYHYFYSDIDVQVKSQTYSIYLNSLKKKATHGLADKDAGIQEQERPTKLLYLQLKEIIPADKTDEFGWSLNKIKTIIIEKISFHRSNFICYLTVIAITVLCYVFFIIFFYIRKKNKKADSMKKPHSLPSIHLKGEGHKKKDIKKIMKIFNNHVFDPEFSIHTINEKTELSPFKISQLIKKRYGLSFIQFLNSIRLKEAKRLLEESDLKIYDIAFKTGYNDTTYFCKIFKKQCGMTPTEYRSRYGE